jgi:hypothetical protein
LSCGLLASSLKRYKSEVRSALMAKVTCITFGAPQVSDHVGAAALVAALSPGHLINLVHEHDVIPKLLLLNSEAAAALGKLVLGVGVGTFWLGVQQLLRPRACQPWRVVEYAPVGDYIFLSRAHTLRRGRGAAHVLQVLGSLVAGDGFVTHNLKAYLSKVTNLAPSTHQEAKDMRPTAAATTPNLGVKSSNADVKSPNMGARSPKGVGVESPNMGAPSPPPSPPPSPYSKPTRIEEPPPSPGGEEEAVDPYMWEAERGKGSTRWGGAEGGFGQEGVGGGGGMLVNVMRALPALHVLAKAASGFVSAFPSSSSSGFVCVRVRERGRARARESARKREKARERVREREREHRERKRARERERESARERETCVNP